jgi:ABC-type transport system involved in multi-copper enzyme maturation permease subunit
MDKLWLLSFNTFEDALRRRVIYILLFVALLFGIQTLYQLVYMRMAASAGESEMLASMKGQLVLSLFGMMEFWGMLLAVFLGSVAVSSEVKSRTIIPVLSRPVERVPFFFAKWLGTLAFLTLFLAVGLAAGLAIAAYWQLYPSTVFVLGMVEMFLTVAIVSGLSLGLSSVLHPVLAGGTALVLWFLPAFTAELAHHPNVFLSFIAVAARTIAPARLDESLLENGLLKGLTNPDYKLYVEVLVENALYAGAAVLAGALVFRRREIAVK